MAEYRIDDAYKTVYKFDHSLNGYVFYCKYGYNKANRTAEQAIKNKERSERKY